MFEAGVNDSIISGNEQQKVYIMRRYVIVQSRVWVFIRGSKQEQTIKTPRFLLLSSIWILLMKHYKQVFEPASQTSLPINLLLVSFTDSNV